ncbi:MAG: hypothetical protein Q7R47_03635 [Candidatus Diapherotrites archaeon]|nr:hypothetical protein [Candidatus Diapherotrites archaeon]
MNGQQTGQSSIEALMAVFVILGIFVVISLISVQRTSLNHQVAEFDQNAVICDRLSVLIEKADGYAANMSAGFFLDRPLSIYKGSISFGATGHYCYFAGRVFNAVGQSDLSIPIPLNAGYYELRKENNQITIQSVAAPS